MFDRAVVIGTAGSGKSTLARRIAAIIAGTHIELDSLFHEPNWKPAETEVFRGRIRAKMAASARWVADGNYSISRPVVWAAADTAIWLDYSFPCTFSRLVRRTFTRRIHNEELWNGNRESLRTNLFTNDSLFLWAITTHWKHRRTYPEHFVLYPNLRVIRMRSPRETEAWLRAFEADVQSARAGR